MSFSRRLTFFFIGVFIGIFILLFYTFKKRLNIKKKKIEKKNFFYNFKKKHQNFV